MTVGFTKQLLDSLKRLIVWKKIPVIVQICKKYSKQYVKLGYCLGSFIYNLKETSDDTALQRVLKKIFFNWDSLHARLNSHYEVWTYKKMKRKKIKAYRKPV